MAENIYRFEFLGDEDLEKISAGVEDTLDSGVDDEKKKKKKKTFSTQFNKKVEDTALNTFVISPLNTVTGGLASPIANTIKRLRAGAKVGATFGALGATVTLMAIRQLQTRMQELETKVQNLNNADNVLIRAGSVSKATYYSANLFGIKKNTDRS